MQPDLDPSTNVVTAGRPPRIPDSPLNTPIVLASNLHAEGDVEYGREGNETTHSFEKVLGDLEGGHAVAFSSGMAAANAIMDLFPPGARILAPSNTYTGVAVRLRELHERGAISLRIVNITNTAAVLDELDDAQILWLESPTNPLLDTADLPVIMSEARTRGVTTVVDNTFATPVRQQPLALGADFVLHSVTKMLSGHSDLLMGAVVSSTSADSERIRIRRVLLGAVPSPFDSYLALRGIRTLFLRFEKSENNARIVLASLKNHENIGRVRYPGWGSMAALDVVNVDPSEIPRRTRIWTHATSLGGVESLIERRRRWPLEAEIVPTNLIRLSFGIEHPEDLLQDLLAAFAVSEPLETS